MEDSPSPLPCPDCGGATETFREGHSGGTRCTRCAWAVVASCLPPILNDCTRYELFLTGGTPGDERQLRAVARVANINLIQARALLMRRPQAALLSGLAPQIAAARDLLADAGAGFAIAPDFPW